MKTFRLLILLSLGLVFSLNAQDGFDCFSILVGNQASEDGSVLFAHNEDDWGDRIVNWYQVPASKHTVGKSLVLKNGGSLKQANQTYKYLWLEMPEMEFSDSYMNEWGVTIGSDACQSREDKPEITDGGIGYWLRRAMAERAKSAREAVKIGGALVEQYGYTSSGRTYVIADAQEAWMLAVVKGKHWVAQRVPDDHIAIIPNYYTIAEVDLDDTINFYGCRDLVEYAVERKWYKPKKDGAFNFRLAYSDKGTLENTGNIVRNWSAHKLVTGDDWSVDDSFPFSFKPKKPVSLTELFTILRNHNEGSTYDKSEGYTRGNPHDHGRAICSKTTQYGFVAQLRTGLPKELAYVLWLAPFRPCVHPFTQWYFGMNTIPEKFAEGEYRTALDSHFEPIENVFEFAPDNHFLEFVKYAKRVDQQYEASIQQIRSKIEQLESELLQNQEDFEKRMAEQVGQDPAVVAKAIGEYCAKQLNRSMELMEQ